MWSWAQAPCSPWNRHTPLSTAGARFIVAPGLNRKVVEFCLQRKRCRSCPGIATPSEVEAALELGLEAVKFFPAEANGGLDFLKAIAAPYRSIKFVPTGGIQQSNLLGYLKFPRVLACGGSWMVDTELIAAKKFDEIRRLTQEAIHLMLGFELRHVGINGSPGRSSKGCRAAGGLSSLRSRMEVPRFLSVRDSNSPRRSSRVITAIWPSARISPRGQKRFSKRRGYSFRAETASEKDGKLIAIYLQEEISGFALHLLQL